MKCLWEEKDIKGGVRVQTTDYEVWIISYTCDAEKGNLYHLTSLNDGLTIKSYNKLDMAQFLVDGSYKPVSTVVEAVK